MEEGDALEEVIKTNEKIKTVKIKNANRISHGGRTYRGTQENPPEDNTIRAVPRPRMELVLQKYREPGMKLYAEKTHEACGDLEEEKGEG